MRRILTSVVVFNALCFAVACPNAQAQIGFAGDVEAGSPPVLSDPNTWANTTTGYIGYTGDGTVTVDGGDHLLSGMSYVGYSSNAIGNVSVDGNGSVWTNDRYLYVGMDGYGALRITNAGTVNTGFGLNDSPFCYLGTSPRSTGMVMVDGVGSSWNNCGTLFVGGKGSGTLNVTAGGIVTAASVCVYNFSSKDSLLAIDVGNGSQLNIGNGSGTFTNNGKVRILAGAKPTANDEYIPILAQPGTWGGTYGTYQALGGTWSADHVFTVSDVREAVSGEDIENLDLNTTQRVRVDYNAEDVHWTLGASFLAGDNSLSMKATAVNDGSLDWTLAEGESLFGAWDFAMTSGFAVGDPAYLSFDVGSGHSRDDFKVWRLSDGVWTAFDATDLSYDGQYANFTVTGFSGYAVTGAMVPEPGPLALLLAAAISSYVWPWRFRRTRGGNFGVRVAAAIAAYAWPWRFQRTRGGEDFGVRVAMAISAYAWRQLWRTRGGNVGVRVAAVK